MTTSSPTFTQRLAAGYAECDCDAPDEGLVLAVSGGADSMALLHGTVRLWPESRQRIVVVHIDHQLRDQHSRRDARFVSAAAKSLGVTCHVIECDVAATVQREGGGVEETARRLRYEALQKTAREAGFGAVTCAHQQDDQAETVLHHILRGSGLRGLQGMAMVRPLNPSVRLLRPMLRMPRVDIEEFLESNGLDWCTDASNASPEFTRNRIRQELLPLLAEDYNPQVAASLVRLAELARDAEAVVELVAERCLEDVLLELQPAVCRLRRDRLPMWPVSTVRAMLRLLWTRQSWPQQAMTQAHWQLLATSLQDPQATVGDFPDVEISVTPGIVRIFRSGEVD